MISLEDANNPIYTNVRIFYVIAKESLEKMRSYTNRYSKPMLNGGQGIIHRLDPKRRAFKHALIAIVFSGICLEALLHLVIGARLGTKECAKIDGKAYEDKLKRLGCVDQKIFDGCARYRRCRREIVHEKAYLDKAETKTAQDEAEESIAMLDSVCGFLRIKLD